MDNSTFEMKSLDDYGTDLADAFNKIADDLLKEYMTDDEPIDKETLEKQAKEAADLYSMCFLDSGIHTSRNREQGFYDGFIAGYKKAKGL